MTFRVVLDANVIYGILTTDLLITTALLGLHQPYWSEEILSESRRAIERNRPDLDPGALDRRFAHMRAALPQAMTTAPTELVNAMTNHPKDRHVLATAVHVGAETIVTDNVADFPPAACEPHDIEVQSLDVYVEHLISVNEMPVRAALDEMALRRHHPPMAVADILDALRSAIPTSVNLLR